MTKESKKSEPTLLQLEATLTASAFGHEYALMNLTEYTPYSEAQVILAQMEQHKEAYFWARERLIQVDPDKLHQIEEGLRLQKETVLRNNVTIH